MNEIRWMILLLQQPERCHGAGTATPAMSITIAKRPLREEDRLLLCVNNRFVPNTNACD